MIAIHFNNEFETNTNRALLTINNKQKITYNTIEQNKKLVFSRLFSNKKLQSKLNDKKLDALFKKDAINKHIILIEALNNNILNDKKLNDYIWYSIKNSIIQYYLQQHYTKSGQVKNITVNNNEINNIYTKYQDIYNKLGFTKEQALIVIRQTLLQEKKKQQLQIFERDILNTIKLKNSISNTR